MYRSTERVEIAGKRELVVQISLITETLVLLSFMCLMTGRPK